MSMQAKKDRVSLEGFDQLWESDQPADQITKQIQSILKALVDERIQVNKEHHLVNELKEHINQLENQIQKLNWQLGQREKELSILHTEINKFKSENEALEKHSEKHNELIRENYEIRRLAKELSNQILQEKAKNEMLVELLKELKQPDLAKISKKLGI